MDDNGALLVALTDIQILRAELAAANTRCAELEAEVEGLVWRNKQLTNRLEGTND